MSATAVAAVATLATVAGCAGCAAAPAAPAAAPAVTPEPEPEPPTAAAAAAAAAPPAVAVDDHTLFLVGADAARQGLLDALTESGALEAGLIKGRAAPHVRLAAAGEPLGEDELALVACDQLTTGDFNAATYFAELGDDYPQRALLYANVIGSTQTLLEAHPKLTFAQGNGLVCTAKTQRAGRKAHNQFRHDLISRAPADRLLCVPGGRRTNQWESPPGCLLFSVGWKHADASTVVFIQCADRACMSTVV